MDFGFPKDEPADKCTKRRKMTAGFGGEMAILKGNVPAEAGNAPAWGGITMEKPGDTACLSDSLKSLWGRNIGKFLELRSAWGLDGINGYYGLSKAVGFIFRNQAGGTERRLMYSFDGSSPGQPPEFLVKNIRTPQGMWFFNRRKILPQAASR
jgi:hypothetical protein